MITHNVMLRFDAPGVAEQVRDQLRELPALVPEIRSLWVGVGIGGGDSAYDLALVTTHDDQAGLQGYLDHPEHQRVAAFIAQHRTARAVVDSTD